MKTHSRLARPLVNNLAGIAFCLLFSAVGLAADKPDGAELYKQKACLMCHGADGKGYPAIKTPDFTDPKWQASRSDKQMAEVIKKGKPNTTMPPFADKLKDDEIQALVRQIRSWNSGKNADREKKKSASTAR